MRRLSLLALIALTACGADTAAEIPEDSGGIIMLSTIVPPTLITTTTVRFTIEEGQTQRYIELLAERGMTEAEALGTIDAAKGICTGMATAGDSLNESLWEGVARSADAQGPDGSRRVRIAIVAAVEVFCPELGYRVPAGFDT